MKFTKIITIIAIFFGLLSNINAEKYQTCESKKLEIENKLKLTIQHNNTYEINGLKKALKENNRYCNNTILKQDRDKKIQEKQHKLQKLKVELEKEKKLGNIDKINKKERKILEIENELKKLN
ncbi:DUF1090 domain-containing protein [Acinetobacter bereziniae]|uniref:DUF1090 domain-containing protein n=1 Tax=Acinetobacter bereziniae TaxID=106648 RepID=UPI00257577B4|nr:DUF1090 domain-containing protein [Acinetobacter bereziniae]MDM1783476.1 DUF1090 domain-containing protein [Acinetobacter bereziniae]